MTDLRISAQQALEALKMMRDEYEEYACPACDHADAAIYALKAALVEDAMQKFTDVNQDLEAALAEPVEPVAWMFVDDTGMKFVSVDRTHKHCQPLYTAPPQRKPLSEEEIKKLLIESAGMTIQFNDVDLRFARAVELAIWEKNNG